MHSSAIHDPRAGMTPSQILASDAHRARQAKIASRAYSDVPVVTVPALAAPDAPPIAPTDPVKDWAERQKEIYSKLWFHIVDEIEPTKPRYPRVEQIIALTAGHYGVRRHDILSSRRTANIVRPRQVAMYLAKSLTLRSLPEIGRKFGGRDHTTVLHAVRKIAALVADGDPVSEDCSILEKQLRD